MERAHASGFYVITACYSRRDPSDALDKLQLRLMLKRV